MPKSKDAQDVKPTAADASSRNREELRVLLEQIDIDLKLWDEMFKSLKQDRNQRHWLLRLLTKE